MRMSLMRMLRSKVVSSILDFSFQPDMIRILAQYFVWITIQFQLFRKQPSAIHLYEIETTNFIYRSGRRYPNENGN